MCISSDSRCLMVLNYRDSGLRARGSGMERKAGHGSSSVGVGVGMLGIGGGRYGRWWSVWSVLLASVVGVDACE